MPYLQEEYKAPIRLESFHITKHVISLLFFFDILPQHPEVCVIRLAQDLRKP